MRCWRSDANGIVLGCDDRKYDVPADQVGPWCQRLKPDLELGWATLRDFRTANVDPLSRFVCHRHAPERRFEVLCERQGDTDGSVDAVGETGR